MITNDMSVRYKFFYIMNNLKSFACSFNLVILLDV